MYKKKTIQTQIQNAKDVKTMLNNAKVMSFQVMVKIL